MIGKTIKYTIILPDFSGGVMMNIIVIGHRYVIRGNHPCSADFRLLAIADDILHTGNGERRYQI